jgi:hypothetical protein
LVHQIIDVDALAAMRFRSDGDDACGRRGPETVEQEIGEQERRQMVDREGQLEPIR